MDISPSTAVIGNQKILYDAALFDAPPARLFDPQHLAATGVLTGEAFGRGQAWFFSHGELNLVLRHFRRGGAMEKILVDRYWGRNPQHARSWREWRVLSQLFSQGLPVPRPVAARVEVGGFFYRADLITELIPGARSLADWLEAGSQQPAFWHKIGAVIALFHRRGVWHPDLNARNILIDNQGEVFLIDFDQGRLRAGLGPQQNLKRLLRSLRKIKNSQSPFYFAEDDWRLLLEGYQAMAEGT